MFIQINLLWGGFIISNFKKDLSDLSGVFLKAKLSEILGKENSLCLSTLLSYGRVKKKYRKCAVYKTIEAFLIKNDFDVNENDISEFLVSESEKRPFADKETVMVIPFCADIIARRAVKLGLSEELDLLSERSIRLFRSFDVSDVENLRERISLLDRTLSSRAQSYYSVSEDLTKALLRGKISTFAKKHKISEKDAANIYCEQNGFEEETVKRKKNIRIYFFSLVFFSVTLSFFTTVAARCHPIFFFLLIFPISEAVKFVIERIFSLFLPLKVLPRLKIEKIPDSAKTLTVITSLISLKDEAIFRQIEEFYLSNKDKNAAFGLLLDLPESKRSSDEKDIELIRFAKENIIRLNEKYGQNFCLFIRERTKSKSENKYMGYERKRGALIDLALFLRGKGNGFSVFIGDKNTLSEIKYVITLDRDTMLYGGAVRDMVSAMIHPENKPKIENKRVVSGYAIMQPHIATSLASFGKSYFSSFLSRGGIDPYQSAAFDLYLALFDEGIFCGKGIFDVDAYVTLIPDAFADGVILSHDLLEGSRLRCGILADITLSDSHPSTPSAYFKRLHRWIRGDVQASLYAKKYIINREEKREKNPISRLSRFFILDNVRRAAVPVLAAISILLSLFYPSSQDIIAFAALSYCILPAFFGVFSSLGGLRRRFFSHVMPSIGNALWNLIFGISSIFSHALISLDAIFKGFIRSRITRRKTLEWTVSSFDNGGGILSQLSGSLVSYICGTAVLFFANGALIKSAAILWTALPFILLILSFNRAHTKKPSSSEKALLLRYIFDMWSFFAEYVNEQENHLPPDNVQEIPSKTIAHRTSPTNIGMYLVSVLAACDCGFIDAHILADRLENTLSTIENLPKKHGHLYNWYDTQTLSVLGTPYISTVDSGNFVGALSALCEGIKEYEQTEPRLISCGEKIKNIIDSTDFTALFSKKRKLFYIGIEASKDPDEEHCYDLYMSEARLGYYFAIAKGDIPTESWKRLGRPIIENKGYIGVASWSGSMFEYFMPQLFLPSYSGSLAGEALAFAANAQIEDKIKGFWGISENGYHAFDFAMNYQYKANGIKKLALDPIIGKERVISPYSSFLSMPVARRAAIKNLEALKAFGAYGKHGFYEAVDFTRSRVGLSPETVKSYMSHHVGMSIISAANVCFDNIFVKRFMKNPQMSAYRELLCENIPTDTGISKNIRVKSEENSTIRYRQTEKTFKSSTKNGNVPLVCTLSSESSALTLSDAGHIMLSCNDILITRDPFDVYDMYNTDNGAKIFFSADGQAFEFVPDSMSYSGSRAVLKMQDTLNGEKLSASLIFTLSKKDDMFCIKLDVSGKFTSFSPMLAFEVVLTKADDRISHPFYNALSIEAYYSKEYKILMFHARSKDAKDDKWIGVSIENYPLDIEFDTRSDILKLNYDTEDIKKLLFEKLPSRVGACISPFCFIKGETERCSGKISLEFLIAYGSSYEDILRKFAFVRKNTGRDISSYFASSLYPLAQSRLALAGVAPIYLKYADYYLAALYFHPNSNPASDKTFVRNALWAHGISGDLPIVCISLPKDFSGVCRKICDTLIRLHRLCRIRGKKSDLIFITSEGDEYGSKNKNTLFDIISSAGSGELFCGYGGVFSVSDKSDLTELLMSVSALYIPLESDSSIEEIFCSVLSKSLRVRKKAIIMQPDIQNLAEKEVFGSTSSAGDVKVYGGLFSADGFCVDKSKTELVWSYIYSNRIFGSLVTQNSLGFTWFSNSKEKRLTPYFSSYRRDICGERLILSAGEENYDIVASSYFCKFSHGCAQYRSEIDVSGEKYKFYVECGVDPKLPVKMVTAEVRGNTKLPFDLFYSIEPLIGEKICPPNLILKKTDGDCIFFRRKYDSYLSEHTLFLVSMRENEYEENGEKVCKYGFLFGIFPTMSDRAYYHIRERYRTFSDIKNGFKAYADFYENLFSRIQLSSNDPMLDTAVNYYIPYQTFTARLFGRTGFYQSSGAYGFRDQLQDSLAALYYDPDYCKYQILRAAAHQYTQGDVQHWWHNSDTGGGKWHAGLRSKCSDDLLWLPFVVCNYLSVSGDYSLLDKKVRYIESRELDENETTRYERPIRSKYRESLYNHCVRAIERSLRFGEHGLPLIGSCDWNDGFDKVGTEGKGESVWLAQFMKIVLTEFSRVAKNYGDLDGEKKYSLIADNLSKAVEKYCFADNRYLRGFYDNGKALGAPGDKECEIDLLTQSFAAISGEIRSRAHSAMDLACEKLWDRKNKVIKLFTPSFSGKGDIPGYIVGYCDGFRENGGQYTHAALWAVWGLLASEKNLRAYEMLSDINPIARSYEESSAKRYKTEPYALCGDVYSNPEHPGRGGWSLYTGSASWFVRIVFSELISYKENEGKSFSIDPKLSEAFDKFVLKIKKNGRTHTFDVKISEKDGKASVFYNGRKAEAGEEIFFGRDNI